MSSILQAKALKREFRLGQSKIAVLRGVDLDLKAGEKLGVIGASGSGKSTLLNILGGLDQPNSGSVVFAGQSLYQQKEGKLAKIRNRQIGFVFQFHQLLPEFNAQENVAMPLIIDGVKRAEALDKAASLLASVELTQRLEHRPAELSVGEQQRVAIARALICQPQLLLVDEPTGSLDSVTGGKVIELLFSLVEKKKMAMLIVTHNEKLAAKLPCLLRLKDGLIVQKIES